MLILKSFWKQFSQNILSTAIIRHLISTILHVPIQLIVIMWKIFQEILMMNYTRKTKAVWLKILNDFTEYFLLNRALHLQIPSLSKLMISFQPDVPITKKMFVTLEQFSILLMLQLVNTSHGLAYAASLTLYLRGKIFKLTPKQSTSNWNLFKLTPKNGKTLF